MPNSKSLEHRAMPGSHLEDITKSDSTVLSGLRALWIGGAGNVAILASDDSAAVTLTAVPAGTLLPISAKKVMSTNTTATAIVGIY